MTETGAAGPMPADAGQPPRYDLSFRLARADLAAFVRLPRELTGWRKLAAFLPVVLLAVVFGYFSGTGTALTGLLAQLGGWGWVIVIPAGAIAWFVSVTLVMTLSAAFALRRAKLPAGETRLVADATGVTLTTDGSERRLCWREIARVVPAPGQVFLVTGPSDAVIVPFRAFADRAEMARFAAFAEDQSRNAER